MEIKEKILTEISNQLYPHLFITISGAHLYGFASEDSDYDIRGVHILPIQDVAGIEHLNETVNYTEVKDNIEIDLVTHDIKKFFLWFRK
mgnify:FL=1